MMLFPSLLSNHSVAVSNTKQCGRSSSGTSMYFFSSMVSKNSVEQIGNSWWKRNRTSFFLKLLALSFKKLKCSCITLGISCEKYTHLIGAISTFWPSQVPSEINFLKHGKYYRCLPGFSIGGD